MDTHLHRSSLKGAYVHDGNHLQPQLWVFRWSQQICDSRRLYSSRRLARRIFQNGSRNYTDMALGQENRKSYFQRITFRNQGRLVSNGRWPRNLSEWRIAPSWGGQRHRSEKSPILEAGLRVKIGRSPPWSFERETHFPWRLVHGEASFCLETRQPP